MTMDRLSVRLTRNFCLPLHVSSEPWRHPDLTTPLVVEYGVKIRSITERCHFCQHVPSALVHEYSRTGARKVRHACVLGFYPISVRRRLEVTGDMYIAIATTRVK
jgi:hypothetical protein